MSRFMQISRIARLNLRGLTGVKLKNASTNFKCASTDLLWYKPPPSLHESRLFMNVLSWWVMTQKWVSRAAGQTSKEYDVGHSFDLLLR